MNMSSHENNNGSSTRRHTGVEYDHRLSSSNNNFGGKRVTLVSKPKNRSSYFSIESMMVLFGLTVSLLILPLILPPLPPPPFMLLLLPIFILGVLMAVAFMTSSSSLNARHKTGV
uniref:ARGOS-like protein n=1 Tax=Erigeron canadensis TaxID=72917 RepID=UPI001CB9A885|nr:ARGOS-like protein [Erigeron canadensis]